MKRRLALLALFALAACSLVEREANEPLPSGTRAVAPAAALAPMPSSEAPAPPTPRSLADKSYDTTATTPSRTPAAPTRADLTCPTRRPLAIAGVVVDPQLRPAPNVLVRLHRVRGLRADARFPQDLAPLERQALIDRAVAAGLATVFELATTRTDRDGAFTFTPPAALHERSLLVVTASDVRGAAGVIEVEPSRGALELEPLVLLAPRRLVVNVLGPPTRLELTIESELGVSSRSFAPSSRVELTVPEGAAVRVEVPGVPPAQVEIGREDASVDLRTG